MSHAPAAASGQSSLLSTAVVSMPLILLGLGAALVAGVSPLPLLALLFVVMAGACLIAWPDLLTWQRLLSAVILVILFIPIRRYELPGHLPFQLEPYRLLIAFVGLGWIASLLIDKRVTFVRSFLFPPLAAIVLVSAASIAANVGRIEDLLVSKDVLKQFTFLLSFVLVFFLIVGVVKRFDEIDRLLRILVGGGAVVAILALVEQLTGYNVFSQLDRVLPILKPTTDEDNPLLRAGRARVYGSAQHPIGLGELFVLLIPLAIYVAVASRRKMWFVAAGLLGMAAFSTVSRTAVISLAAVGVVYILLRPSQTLRFWPLIVPGLIAVHIAMPGVLGSMYKGIFPKEGLIAQEAGAPVGSSRTASFGPGVHQVKLRPLLGGGYGSRITIGPNSNSFIVDNQWLSTAMETGVAGLVAWVWLFTRFLRQMFRAARRDQTERGWLFVGVAASIAGFAVGMATYDSFSFIQATLVMFFVLGIGCAGLAARKREEGWSERTA